ncbi:UNKNOWN [Stylonychia lemnae]|uniref:Uncharacterized protein n=1 Tax=Stylonychia lemnae TaxID=5949 RepID=A0A077ZV93_STYLE|nr:UNKNOWN [Stylonychia lemnae]|eukprot:CDW73544.1 UNKNOWN [Stylonychia lemnae]
MKVVDKKSNITNTQYKRNLVEDKYVSVQIQEVSFIWAENGASYNRKFKDIPIAKCPAGRFLGETVQTDNFGLQHNYYCPVALNTTLQGNFATKKARFIQILFGGCNQTILSKTNPNLKCANETDIKLVLDDFEMNLLATNQFVDVNERNTNPVKTVINNFYQSSKQELSQGTLLKLGQNFLIKNTSPLSNQIDSENVTYYTIRADERSIGDYKKFQSVIKYYILLDDNILTTTIEVYTISDALSNTGGIIGIASDQIYIYWVGNLLWQILMLQEKRIKRSFTQTDESFQESLENVRQEIGDLYNIEKYLDGQITQKNNTFKLSEKTYSLFQIEFSSNRRLRQIKLQLKQVILRKDKYKIDKRIFKNLDPELQVENKVQTINSFKDSILKNLNKDLKKEVSKVKLWNEKENFHTQIPQSVFSNYLKTEQKKDVLLKENWDNQSNKSDILTLTHIQNRLSE